MTLSNQTLCCKVKFPKCIGFIFPHLSILCQRNRNLCASKIGVQINHYECELIVGTIFFFSSHLIILNISLSSQKYSNDTLPCNFRQNKKIRTEYVTTVWHKNLINFSSKFINLISETEHNKCVTSTLWDKNNLPFMWNYFQTR